MTELPVDVIVDIFTRLPVKTLLRFRCVSKQFLSIIDGKYFVKRHLIFHSLRPKTVIEGIRSVDDDLDSKLSFLDLDSVDNAYKLELPFEDWGPVNLIKVIGSCDGLLALRNRGANTVGLWNVSTKKHRILPQCVFPFDLLWSQVEGFGRHPDSNEYKLVSIRNSDATTQVCVYSSEANSWREVLSVSPYSRYCLCDHGALVEGTLNWLGKVMQVQGRKKKDFILSFDLKNEKISEVLLPDSIEDCEESTLGVKVLGDLLCLLCGHSFPLFDIWVMKEYGLKDSWVKMYSFPEWPQIWFPGFPNFSVYSNHGCQIICISGLTPGRRVFCYDSENGRYEIKSESIPAYIVTVINYVESLVSPN